MKLSRILRLGVLVAMLVGTIVLVTTVQDPIGSAIGFVKMHYTELSDGFFGRMNRVKNNTAYEQRETSGKLQVAIPIEQGQRMLDSSVKIRFNADLSGDAVCEEELNNCASGVVIYSDETKSYILTNRHVGGTSVKCGQGIQARNFYTTLKSKTIAISDKADLALLQVDVPLVVAPIAEVEPVLYEQVILMGQPLCMDWITETGFKSKLEKVFVLGTWANEMTLHTYPGNSGSPVYNMSGEVSQLVFAGFRGMYNIGYTVPLDEIKTFLDSIGFPDNIQPLDQERDKEDIFRILQLIKNSVAKDRSHFNPIQECN